MKKLFFVFLFFLPLPVLNTGLLSFSHEAVSRRLADKLILSLSETSREYPSSILLQTALDGYEVLREEQKVNHQAVITIIDFSLPSDKKRLWVIDLERGKVLFHCLVSHGRNSGERMAEHFSNKPGSYASSPGFYLTGEPYIGKHGLSLLLDGLEKGINDNARERAIVIHGADYVSQGFIQKYGRLGRSYGCPAVPAEMSTEIIETIMGGSCLFVYTNSSDYQSNSPMIKKITSIKMGLL